MKNIVILLLIASSSFVYAQEIQEIEPFSYWIKGKIGESRFEMQFNLDFSVGKEGCFPLSGSYYYLSSSSGVDVVGEYCPITHKLSIRKMKDGAIVEIFELEFDSKKGSGIWSINGKSQPVEIETITQKDKLILLEKMAALSGKKLVLNKETNKIGFSASANESKQNYISFYARGSALHYRESGQYDRSLLAFQILPDENALTLAHIYSYVGFDENEEPNCKYQLFAAVWRYADGQWKKISDQKLINTTNGTWNCDKYDLVTIQGKKLILHNVDDKALVWEWNGSSFAEKK